MTTLVYAIIIVIGFIQWWDHAVLVVQNTPSLVTLQECIDQAKIIQADKSTNEVMICMPQTPKTAS